MNEIIIENDYVVMSKGYRGNLIPNLEINEDELSNLTKSGRKKLAKRLYYFFKKPSLKNMNSLFRFMNRRNLIKTFVKVYVSDKELKIRALRKQYVKLRNQAEEARLAYIEEKGDFFKKKLV